MFIKQSQFDLSLQLRQSIEQKMSDEPTIAELNLAIVQLTNRFANINKIESILTTLYIKLVLGKNQFDNLNCNKISLSKAWNNIQFEKDPKNLLKKLSSRIGTTQNVYWIPSQHKIPEFKNYFQKFHFYQKQIAAQTFVSKGYGIHLYRQQIKKHGENLQVTQNRYKSMTTGFVTEAFRKLQNFLDGTCKYAVKRCSRVQTRNLFSILLNCRRLFGQKQIQTFLKFVSLIFNQKCTGIAVTKTEAVKFYESARLFLKQKMFSTSQCAECPSCSLPFPTPTSNSYNNPLQSSFSNIKKDKRLQLQRCEDNLLDIYMSDPRFGVTKERYATLYGYNVKYSTSAGVQSVIFRMVRKAIKTIQDLHKQCHGKITPLVILNDYKIKRILTNAEAGRIRVKLLQFYRMKEANLQNLRQLTSVVNDHVNQRDEAEQKNAKPGMAAYYRKYEKHTTTKYKRNQGRDPYDQELIPQIFINKVTINQKIRE